MVEESEMQSYDQPAKSLITWARLSARAFIAEDATFASYVGNMLAEIWSLAPAGLVK